MSMMKDLASSSFWLSSLMGTVGGAVIGVWLVTGDISIIKDQLSETPPVVVVDFAKISMSYPQGATEKELEGYMVKTKRSIEKLKKAGYLVLDASNVLAAPEDVYLPVEE